MIYKLAAILIFFIHLTTAQDSQSFLPLMKSFVLPGWGNYDLGQKNSFYIHASLDLILAVSYIYENRELSRLDRANRLFAESDLNLIADFDDTFYETIARYNSYDQYIEYELRKGKNIQELYNKSYYWKWSTESNRLYYSDQRFLSIRKERDMRYYLYAMVINRMVSVITTYIGLKEIRTQFRIKNNNQKIYQLQMQVYF